MKVEILLAIMCISIGFCERQQRSTVLTDEYKRVLEHFDFSNFDKQEALNYIDRQRYENQIRGKRSHSKFKRGHDKNSKIPDAITKTKECNSAAEIKTAYSPDSQICKKPHDSNQFIDPQNSFEQQNSDTPWIRRKRGRHHKKKHRVRYDLDDEDYDSYEFKRHGKRKKKKKKKRQYWNEWSEWSPCSVTCGRGRRIRWRKCIVEDCTTGDLEMGEKTCQLPACNLLTKLLGL